jgi:CBS domain-containing protein
MAQTSAAAAAEINLGFIDFIDLIDLMGASRGGHDKPSTSRPVELSRVRSQSASTTGTGMAQMLRKERIDGCTAVTNFASRGGTMAKLARDVMTADPVCCSPTTTLDQIARLMTQNDCGQIPILDEAGRPIGVVTDRDIICRVVADGIDPRDCTAAYCMSEPVFTVDVDAPIDDVVDLMEEHQVRRLPVLDRDGICAGIISQADIVSVGQPGMTAELLAEISREPRRVTA